MWVFLSICGVCGGGPVAFPGTDVFCWRALQGVQICWLGNSELGEQLGLSRLPIDVGERVEAEDGAMQHEAGESCPVIYLGRSEVRHGANLADGA